MKAKKIIIPVSVIAGIAVIGTAVALMSSSASSVAYADTVKITQKELENKISVSGTVESSEKKNVYSKLNYPVEKINVSVGDVVKRGDVLCTISTEDLQQQILQQQAAVENSGISSDYNLSDIEQKYADALADYNEGRNTALVNAQKAVEQAEKALDDAKRQKEQGTGTTLPSNIQNADAQIKSAEQQVESAKNQLESANMNYETALKAYNDAEDALKPENYSGDLKDLSEKIEDYEHYIVIVKNGLTNVELDSAKNEFEKAEKYYYEVLNFNSNAAAYGYDPYSQETTAKATEDYQKAKQKYEELVEKFKLENLEDQLKAFNNQLENSIDALEKARDSAKASLDNAQANVNSAKTAVDSAQLAYDKAVSDYDNTGKVNENTSESYSIAVKNAEDALETAKKDYDLAVQQVESELASLKKQAEQQRTISGLNDPQVIILQNYRDKLEYAVVTAPCDGVITAVNAEEGAVPTGSLFTIEDLDSLVISASVGEYDIPYVSEGMDAVIRCDALGDEEFDGKITDVAPTAAASSPAASTSAGVSYKIEASIDGGSDKLFTGMSAKLNIISERKSGALTVTYDALTTDEDGNDVVYAAEKDETGVYHAKKIIVTVGLETDYEVEIISDELRDGMLVLTNTALISDGAIVNVSENEPEAEAE
ncbi:MAG: efflux RND transporter periplasmic adaptor subunit [Oscillospiraceae bacterium]|nr:efflux RND transporter periplasmic adaptor subunit [Oscillospiraceae bacterium]